MSLIESLLRRIPYVRRPFFQRDVARAEVLAIKAKLAGGSGALTGEARKFFPEECHFVLPLDDERQDRRIGEFRPYIKRAVGKKTRALEIGPSLNPILPKAEGYNVAVLDHAGEVELVAKYAPHGIDTRKIEPVDFIWQGESLAEMAGRDSYEAIVASHVIEHAPDFIRFLRDCSESLTSTGTLHLLIPDRRYCFDFFQPLSDVAKVLGDHRAKRTRHSFESFYRVGTQVKNGEAIAWSQDGAPSLRFPHGDPHFARQLADASVVTPAYEDMHENYFTPMSFMMLVDELRYLREIDLTVTLLTRARGCEFLAVLAKINCAETESAQDFLARKMCAYRLLMSEEIERIQSIG
jgi:predicted SAM-dependent methyltransferase